MSVTTIAKRSGTQHDHDHGHSHDHDHDHDHGDSHDHVSVPVGERAPTGDAVVFDIGDGIGALIVRLDESLAGTELPIKADDPTVHVHTGVWRRTVGGQEMVLAIYPELPEGAYRFPAGAHNAAGDVTIESGKIANLDLRC